MQLYIYNRMILMSNHFFQDQLRETLSLGDMSDEI